MSERGPEHMGGATPALAPGVPAAEALGPAEAATAAFPMLSAAPGLGPGPPVSPARRAAVVRLAAPLTALLVVAAFYPAIGNGFAHIDDSINILNNPSFVGVGRRQFLWAWRAILLGVYQPVAWMCLSAESAFWGTDLRGYHVVSILLHVANVILLARLAVRVLGRCSAGPGGGARRAVSGASVAAAAAVYAVSPQRAEVVAWASCQPYLLCSFFGLLSVHAYLTAQGAVPPWRSRLSLFASYLLFWAALLCKAPAISLPALLLVLDVYPLRRPGAETRPWAPRVRQLLWEKLPFFTLAIPFMYFTRRIRGDSLAELPPRFQGPLARLAHACYSVWFYPAKAVWPFDLICHYEAPRWASPTAPVFLASTVAVVALTVLLVAARNRRPGLLAAWAAYLTLLAPTSGLSPVGTFIAADRYSYLPAMAWVPPLALVIDRLARRGGRVSAVAVALGLAGILAGSVTLSRAQSRTWRDPLTLWRHALDHGGEQSVTVHNNVGVALADLGEMERALSHFTRSLKIFVTINTFNNRLNALSKLKMVDAGVEELSEQIRLHPDEPHWRYDLGRFLLPFDDRLDEAVAQFREVVRREPGSPVARYWLGLSLAKKGAQGEALVHLSESVRLQPGVPWTHSELGSVLTRMGRHAEALDQFSKALQANPRDPEIRKSWREAALKVEAEANSKGPPGDTTARRGAAGDYPSKGPPDLAGGLPR